MGVIVIVQEQHKSDANGFPNNVWVHITYIATYRTQHPIGFG